MRSANDHDLMQLLLVEDSPGDALLVQEALQKSGTPCQITVARDGEAALAMLRGDGSERAIAPPDLILLDLNLPKQTGHEILAQLKASDRLHNIPVVVFTSSRAERDVSTAYDLHCNAYFCKPSSFGDYQQLTRLIADFWLKAVVPRATDA